MILLFIHLFFAVFRVSDMRRNDQTFKGYLDVNNFIMLE